MTSSVQWTYKNPPKSQGSPMCPYDKANMKIDPCSLCPRIRNDSVDHSLPRKLDMRYAEYENWVTAMAVKRKRRVRGVQAPSKAITFPHIRFAVVGCCLPPKIISTFSTAMQLSISNTLPPFQFFLMTTTRIRGAPAVAGKWRGARWHRIACVMQVSDRRLRLCNSQWQWRW